MTASTIQNSDQICMIVVVTSHTNTSMIMLLIAPSLVVSGRGQLHMTSITAD